MKEIESASTNKKSRLNILLGLGLLSLFPILKFGLFSGRKKAIACSPSDQKGTVRMLTQDGRLVEVDVSKINATKTKVSDKELIAWIKR